MSKSKPEPKSARNTRNAMRVIDEFNVEFEKQNPGKKIAWTTNCVLWVLSYLEMHSDKGWDMSFEAMRGSSQDCIQVELTDGWVVMKERVITIDPS